MSNRSRFESFARSIHEGNYPSGFVEHDDEGLLAFAWASFSSGAMGFRENGVADDGTAFFVVCTANRRTVMRQPEHGVRHRAEKVTATSLRAYRFWMEASDEYTHAEIRQMVKGQKEYCEELGGDNFESVGPRTATVGGYRVTPLSGFCDEVFPV